MAVAYVYFVLLNLVAIVITSGTDVCSCNQCRAHRNRIDRCECCRYYQIGRKRSGDVPTPKQVSEPNDKGIYDDQFEDGASAGHNSRFLYQLELLRHGVVDPCKGEDCFSLWSQLKTSPLPDGLVNLILDKKSAANVCNLPAIFRRGTSRLCHGVRDPNQAGLTAEKFGQEFIQDRFPVPFLPRPFAWRFSDRWQTAAAGRDIPLQYNPRDDLFPEPLSLPEADNY